MRIYFIYHWMEAFRQNPRDRNRVVLFHDFGLCYFSLRLKTQPVKLRIHHLWHDSPFPFLSQLCYLQNNTFIFYLLVIFLWSKGKAQSNIIMIAQLLQHRQGILCVRVQPCKAGRQIAPLFNSLKSLFTSLWYIGHNLAKERKFKSVHV